MDAMRQSIDATSYGHFDTSLTMVQLNLADRKNIMDLADARADMEFAITQTVRIMKERNLNAQVLPLHGTHTPPRKGGSRKATDGDSLGQPILVSAVHNEDEVSSTASVGSMMSAITGGSEEPSEEWDEEREEYDVDAAVNQAVSSGFLPTVLSTFKIHNKSRGLIHQDFNIMIYSLQFSTEQAGRQDRPDTLAAISQSDFPVYFECMDKRTITNDITKEAIDSEVKGLFTPEVNNVTIPLRQG
jgi:hypothetical protein